MVHSLMDKSMLYQISKASKAYGADVVFEDVTFDIKGTEKIAIVGRNGCGKTTFLRCMCEEETFDKANINKQSGTTIGYLAQKVLENDEATVEEELMKIYAHITSMQEEMHMLEKKMEVDATSEVLDAYAKLQEEFEAHNGYAFESEMNTVFTRFGFQKEDLKKKIKDFSGGEKTRIAFVKLLLSKPDILLLDEPTNHLDVSAIEWLEGYIKNYPKAVVVVSHDRMFLDRVVDVVYHMEFHKMKRYAGNYSSYITQRENDLERNRSMYMRQQKDIERLEALIEKFRYKKNKAKFAQSKIKYLERMERVELDKQDTKTFHAKFQSRLKGGERVLEIDHLKIGYEKELADISLEMHRGNRIGILGANGTGKSTFVKTLMQIIPPLSGHYLFGHQIEIGYFDQQLAQFSSGKTVLEEIWDDYPDLDQTEIRGVLGQFLFTADDVFKSVDVLSGGEKVRLSLAKLLLKKANLLILDEPTNHLDIPGKEALEESLKGFDGSILFVSHDRYFIQQLANALLVFENGGATFIDKTYKEYTEGVSEVKEISQKEEVKEKKKPRHITKATKDREIRKIEDKITKKEEELEAMRALRFEPEYYQDYQKMNALDEDIDDIHNELAHLMEMWEELNELDEKESN